MSKKNQISYVKPTEPAFLQQFKKRAGFKEGPTVEDKKQELAKYVDDGSDERPDERPQIVTLKAGDLTELEVAAIEERLKEEKKSDGFLDLSGDLLQKPNNEYATAGESDSKDDQLEGKVLFRKPGIKRPVPEQNSAKPTSDKKSKHESEMARVRNTNLLSFGDAEEDEK